MPGSAVPAKAMRPWSRSSGMERKLSTGAGAPNRRRLEEASGKALQAHHVEVGFLAWGPMTILVTISCRNNVAWVTALSSSDLAEALNAGHCTKMMQVAPQSRDTTSPTGNSRWSTLCEASTASAASTAGGQLQHGLLKAASGPRSPSVQRETARTPHPWRHLPRSG